MGQGGGAISAEFPGIAGASATSGSLGGPDSSPGGMIGPGGVERSGSPGRQPRFGLMGNAVNKHEVERMLNYDNEFPALQNSDSPGEFNHAHFAAHESALGREGPCSANLALQEDMLTQFAKQKTA